MANAPDNLAERNAHIPTAEIEQDIVDTEREIARMELEAEHLAATPISMLEARWNHIKADARRSGIKERQEFIGKLRRILEARSSDGANSQRSEAPALVEKKNAKRGN